MKPIAVLGTGMAGLGAGYALERAAVPFVCYDKNAYLGGHTRSFRYDSGFVFDEGGHISFTKHDHVRDVLAKNIRGQYEERSLEIDNYWHGYRIPHPVQCNLRGLPSDLVMRVIQDFVAPRRAKASGGPELRRVARRHVRQDVRRDVSDGLRSQVPHDDHGSADD